MGNTSGRKSKSPESGDNCRKLNLLDEDSLQIQFQLICDPSSTIEIRQEALSNLRDAYVPNKSLTSDYAKEVSRVFSLRYPGWNTGEGGWRNKYIEVKIADCIRGIVFGAAVGDAAGLATEFLSKAQIESFYFNRDDRASFVFKPGCVVYPDIHRVSFTSGDWTDDTDQLILGLITILEGQGHVNPVNFAKHLHDWKNSGFPGLGDQGGCGLGKSTKLVIQHNLFLNDPIQAAQDVWIKSGKKLAANGALMRTAITAVPFFWDLDVVKENTLNLCKCTHADPRCQVSCLFLCLMIAKLLQYWANYEEDSIMDASIPSDYLFDIWQSIYKECELLLIDLLSVDDDESTITEAKEEFRLYCSYEALINMDLSDLSLDDGLTMGYTYKCLSSALLALLYVTEKGMRFDEAMQLIIREGGDADTNCAVAGALLGAYGGVKSISSDWIPAMPYDMWMEAWVQKVLYMMNLPVTR